MTKFTMEVPPIVETQLTGYIGAAHARRHANSPRRSLTINPSR